MVAYPDIPLDGLDNTSSPTPPSATPAPAPAALSVAAKVTLPPVIHPDLQNAAPSEPIESAKVAASTPVPEVPKSTPMPTPPAPKPVSAPITPPVPPAPTPMSSHDPVHTGHSGAGPIVGIVIIVLILIVGALYFWGAQQNRETAPLPLIPGDATAQ